MASFHCAVKSGGGGRGSSHSDYIEREGKYKTGDRDDLEHAETLNLPAWAANSAEFWKQSDLLERANSSGYREYEIGLPREMTPEQRLAFVREFITIEIGEKHVCTFAIHCPSAALEGGEQPHAHIMFSERTHDGIERATPELYFKRANTKQPERGGCKKANGVPKTPTERKVELVALRARFAALQNKHLEQLGHADRVTHLSLKDQGIERVPESHLGLKRIQARSPEVVQLMAARADRTLSALLRQSIAAGERRLVRLVKVQQGRRQMVVPVQPVLTPAQETQLFDDALGKYTRLRTEKTHRVAIKAEKRQERRQKAVQAVLRRRPSEPTGMFAALKQRAYRQALDALEPVYQQAQKLVKQAEGLAGRLGQVAHQAQSWAYDKLRQADPALARRVEAHRAKERIEEYTRQKADREARQALKPQSKGMSR